MPSRDHRVAQHLKLNAWHPAHPAGLLGGALHPQNGQKFPDHVGLGCKSLRKFQIFRPLRHFLRHFRG